jgi:hypothetical protein
MPTLRLPRLAGPSAALLALALSASGCFSGASHPITPGSPVIQSFQASPTAVASGGTATLSWSVSGADTLSIAPGVGTVTGTSVQVAPTATTTYTLTATNAGGSSTSSVTVTVVQPPSGLAYAINPAVYAAGTAITANTPSYAGGVVSSWTVSPALPAGLSLDASTGIITGTPTAVTAEAVYTITGTNAAGSTSIDLDITVGPAVAPPTSLVYTPNPVSCSVASACVSTPSNGGGAIVEYTVSPPLPSGLTLDSLTGVLGGAATDVAAQGSFVVTGSNPAGSTIATLRITVTNAVPPVITTQPADQAVVPPATATFTVVATDPGTINYQWQKNGVDIPGATSASYTTPATTGADGGSHFRVVVSNAAGASVTSNAATLRVQGFATTGSMATARVSHSATLLQDGRVLVVGGTSGTGTLATAELYDPAAGTFASTGSLITARQGHSAVLLADGTVLVVGGYSGAAYLASAELYDPSSGTFSPTANDMPDPRMDFAAALVGGNVLVAGGFYRTGGGSSLVDHYLATAVLYDPATRSFGAAGSTPSMSAERRGPAAAPIAGPGLLIAGGRSSSGVTASADAFAANAFTGGGTMTQRREYTTATTLPDGKVLVAGGFDGGSSLSSADLFDPGTSGFVATGSLASARSHHTASALVDGRVVVTGGTNGVSFLGSTEIYDPSASTFTAATGQNLVTPRDDHVATRLGDGRVLVTGGRSANGILSSAEIYTPVP